MLESLHCLVEERIGVTLVIVNERCRRRGRPEGGFSNAKPGMRAEKHSPVNPTGLLERHPSPLGIGGVVLNAGS